MSIEGKFSRLGTDNAPGQEARQDARGIAASLRGEPLPGTPVDFSHGDVDAHEPTPRAQQTFSAAVDLGGRPDGAISGDGRVMGCYLHGIFAADDFRRAFLKSIKADFESDLNFNARVDATLDALADHLERHVAIDRIWEIANAR